MFNEHYYCVIMAGGIGSRFWPLSREEKPKQFLDLTRSGKSLLQLTYERMKQVVREDNIIVVSQRRYKDLVTGQLPSLREDNLFLEPYRRNTAPCLAFATYSILKRDPLAVVTATPSDHIIGDEDIFLNAMSTVLDHAATVDSIITMGVVATRPDHNFGYIQTAGHFEDDRPVRIKTFTEKPSTELAQVFIESGEFLWNSGIFTFRASTMREEIELRAPEIASLWKGWKDVLGTPAQEEFLERIYPDCPKISIDYAVMEKTDNAWVYPARFKWADIGNWDSLYGYLSSVSGDGNASHFAGKGLIKDCSKNIIYSSGKEKLTAICGMDQYMIIDTEDVLLICPRKKDKFNEFISELAMPDYSDFR